MARGNAIALLTTVIIAAFVVTTAAVAARPATPSEREMVSKLYDASPECSRVVISDVSPRYARWQLTPSLSCEQTIDGFAIARRDDTGRWRDVYQASEGSDACPLTPLPTAVGVELGACSKPSRHTYLSTFRGLKIRPSRLDYGTRNQLLGLRWKQWGSTTSTATGTFFYNDRVPSIRFRVPVRVTVSKRSYCRAKRTYLRFKVSAIRARDRDRIRFAAAAQTYDCAGDLVLR